MAFNTAGNSGGGIANLGHLSLSHSTISHNRVNKQGGGLTNYAHVEIENSLINHNEANEGGGIFNGLDMTIKDTKIEFNRATERGGGIINVGVGLGRPKLKLINTTVSHNSASIGGGIYNTDCKNLHLEHSEVVDNIHENIGPFTQLALKCPKGHAAECGKKLCLIL